MGIARDCLHERDAQATAALRRICSASCPCLLYQCTVLAALPLLGCSRNARPEMELALMDIFVQTRFHPHPFSPRRCAVIFTGLAVSDFGGIVSLVMVLCKRLPNNYMTITCFFSVEILSVQLVHMSVCRNSGRELSRNTARSKTSVCCTQLLGVAAA